MKLQLCALAAALLVAASSAALAQSDDRDAYRAGYRDGYRAGYDAGRNGAPYDDRMERRDRDQGDYQDNGYGPPPPRDDRDMRWRQRYSQDYTYRDDSYYRDCRTHTDPAGVIAGALIGGLIGNAASHGHGAGTVAGVVVGGAAGAALSSSTSCGDRSYIYRTYYEAFTAGRSNRKYEWRNPDNGDYGRVLTYDDFKDDDGFRCMNFGQTFFIHGDKRERRGVACQQPDGTWAVVR